MLRWGINCKPRTIALAIYMKRAICHFDLLIGGTSILNPPILSSIFIDKFSHSLQPSSCCHFVVTHTSDHKPAWEHLTLWNGEERGDRLNLGWEGKLYSLTSICEVGKNEIIQFAAFTRLGVECNIKLFTISGYLYLNLESKLFLPITVIHMTMSHNHSVKHLGCILHLLAEWKEVLCSNFFQSSDLMPAESTIKNSRWKNHF